MTSEFPVLTEQERSATVAICILAAFADGSLSENERNEIKRVAEKFSSDGLNLSDAYQEALAGTLSLRDAAARVQSTNGKALAHEMAVCICHVDRAETAEEKNFLATLRRELNLDAETAARFQASAAALGAAAMRQPPMIKEVAKDDQELDAMILNRAILTGALELMPQRLATMAIVPVRIRTVYSIGKKYGYDLDWSHAKEFLATVGVGMASQMVEGYLSRLVTGMTRRMAGKWVASLAGQATESAFAFATTYALGHAAKAYYASGRTLTTGQLRNVFSTMLKQGESMKAQYLGPISEQARSLNVADLIPLVSRN
jgi:uncharacterized protein (DUF697 family)